MTASMRRGRRSRSPALFLFLFLFPILLLAGLVPAGIASAEPIRYLLDPGASRLVVHVGKTGLFGFAGHEHEVVADSITGTFSVDLRQLEKASVDLTIAAPRLRVTGKGEPAKDVPKVQETMTGPSCLDAARFPAIRFVSRAISIKPSVGAKHNLEILGDLTLHGVTRKLTVPVEVELGGDQLTGRGRTIIHQRDFGITPISVGGVVKVENDVALEWLLVGRRAP
jgi:polyisoprenoid-binding protein YceI